MMETNQVLILTARIAAVGSLISWLELISYRNSLKDNTLLSGAVMRGHYKFTSHKLMETLWDYILGYPGVLVLLTLGAVSSLAILVFGFTGKVGAILSTILVICHILISLRQPQGQDAADQVYLIVFLTTALGFSTSNTTVQNICIIFLAFQSCLSYFTAGVAKAFSPTWMKDTALIYILKTSAYGNPRISNTLSRNTRIAYSTGVIIVLFEIAFPLILILPPTIAYIILTVGLIFHLGNALVMGLNSFLWAFLSLYPAVIYVNSFLQSVSH